MLFYLGRTYVIEEMRHTDYCVHGPAKGKTPLAAYGRLVAGLVSAVLISAVTWAGWLREQLRNTLLRRIIPPEGFDAQLDALWAVEATGNPVRDALMFAVSRLESPVVVWPVVAFGVLTLVLEHRRGRFDVILGRRR